MGLWGLRNNLRDPSSSHPLLRLPLLPCACRPQWPPPFPQVFGIMEQAKMMYMLEDYSVNQISLEDIFLSFSCPVPPALECGVLAPGPPGKSRDEILK